MASPTKLELFNRALAMIGARRLESITIDRDARYELEDAYAFTLQYCLEQGMWEFAMRTVSISATSLPTLDYAMGAAFTVPADEVHTYLLGSNENFAPPLTDAVQADGYYFARTSPIYVRYVSNDVGYGGLLTRWPNVFANYFIAELASQVAFQLLRSGEVAKAVMEVAQVRLLQARATDAILASTGILPYNALVRRELTGSTEIMEPHPFPSGLEIQGIVRNDQA